MCSMMLCDVLGCRAGREGRAKFTKGKASVCFDELESSPCPHNTHNSDIYILYISEKPMSSRRRIFHEGPLLHAVQEARIFEDSKTFVDMPLKREPIEVLRAFQALPDISSATLREFISSNFEEAGSDLQTCALRDWRADPEFLARVSASASAPEG